MDEDDEPEILRSEVEEALRKLKSGNAAGFDNIPAEFINSGGANTIDVLHKICNSVWKRGVWPSMDKIPDNPTAKAREPP